MAIAALVLGILALIFGLAGFGAGCWAVVQVLAWQRSTHRITHVAPEMPESRIETDVPQHILDQLSDPVSLEDYSKLMKREKQDEEFDKALWDE